ncbi:WecB/TagA/CpsF family glycosyltransferase [Bosea sp. TWI1241]|uniref:WecB/TagA/CpsF family glycosyltransferase n=1 Tax=Bosea sp. TWI1241 TaxID=3148904 RepID=UPI00320B4E1A
MNALSVTHPTLGRSRGPHPSEPPRDIAGVQVAALSRADAVQSLTEAMDEGRFLRLAFSNANLVNHAARDATLRAQLAGFLILPDGVGMDIASRLLHGRGFPANLNGTDFIPALLAAQPRGRRVALLGGRPGVAERAAEVLRQAHPAHDFTVLGPGYFSQAEETALLRRLEDARPDLLLVAFGNPRQERWIARHLSAAHCSIAAGVGALFDFIAGDIPRAPETMRRLRLEWLFRLAREPRRLWRRYVVGNPLFLARVLIHKLRTGRSRR